METITERDEKGHLTHERLSNGSERWYDYNADGKLTHVRLSNGGNATVVVRCEMGCWNIAVFGSLPSNPGTNCGDFSRDSWHASQGMLHRPGADLQGVTHWLLGN